MLRPVLKVKLSLFIVFRFITTAKDAMFLLLCIYLFLKESYRLILMKLFGGVGCVFSSS